MKGTMRRTERRAMHAAPVRRAWYEHAGAELMALALGIAIGALAAQRLDWRQVFAIAALGFLIASASVFCAALWANVRVERARAHVSRGTLQKLRGVAPETRDVPREHRRER